MSFVILSSYSSMKARMSSNAILFNNIYFNTLKYKWSCMFILWYGIKNDLKEIKKKQIHVYSDVLSTIF